jgi:DNA-binding LytR/AlgR family response regulator
MQASPITALIAEDEPVLAEALERLLGQLWPSLQVLARLGTGEALCQAASELLPAVLFIDIQMPGMTGLEAAERIVEDWPDHLALPLIVFVTAYDQYAVQGFERAALDYVLKPVRRERLEATCQRLQAQLIPRGDPALDAGDDLGQRLHAAQPAVLATPVTPAQPLLKVVQAASGNAIHVIPIEDILYFEAADKYVRIVTRPSATPQPERLIRTPLRELLPRLDPDVFWQIHRGTVVNMRAVDRISRLHHRTRVHLREHTDTLDVSRMYTHLFKSM